MSNLRSKAAEIKAAAEAERGNFEPHGVPKRMYQYWLGKSRTMTASQIRDGQRRENFCHFWRVVAIWAPLMFLKTQFVRFVESKAGTVTGVVLVAALLGAVALATKGMAIVVILGAFFAAGLIAALGFGIAWLINRYWNKDWNKTLGKAILVTLAAIAIGIVVYGIVMAIIATGWTAVLVLFGVLAACAIVAFGVNALLTYISGKRAIANAERQAAIDHWIHTGEGPNPYAREVKEPGKISKFFSGVADFLILISQVVRVKKWKICPMVDIKD